MVATRKSRIDRQTHDVALLAKLPRRTPATAQTSPARTTRDEMVKMTANSRTEAHEKRTHSGSKTTHTMAPVAWGRQ
jgi:hypothetical protein